MLHTRLQESATTPRLSTLWAEMDGHVLPRTEGIAATLPLYPFMFAMYPVARLYEENMFEVSLTDVLGPLLLVLSLTAVGVVALTVLMGDVRRAALVATAIVLPVTMFGLVHEIVEPAVGDVRIVLLVASVGLVGLAVWVALRVVPRLGSITLGLNVMSIVLVVLAAVPAVEGVAAEVSNRADFDGPVAPSITAERVPDRDIYHLVLDRYGSEAGLEAGLGINNGVFTRWLRDQGFDVVDAAYANYTKTTLSLASTLGMELLDDVVDEIGPDGGDLSPAEYRIKNSRAGAFLQDHGFEYIHIGSWFDQTRDSRIADRSEYPTAEVSFGTTLYDLSVLPMLLVGSERVVDSKLRHATAAEYQFERLEDLAARPGRTYLLAHILLPHPPFVFLEDGTFAPEEATFESQLADTNRRLRAFLEPLLAAPEAERPIIVIQGDEGPYPERWEADRAGFDWATATDDEILTKFGILNAMYLPGAAGAAPLRDDLSAVNTYPELLRRYFGSDIEDQPDQVLASNEARPYDLVDLTTRLGGGRSD